MDKRSGLIHELPNGKTLAQLAHELHGKVSDFEMLGQPPSPQCKRCGGTGTWKGRYSKRWKACHCTRKPHDAVPSIGGSE